MRNVFVSYSHDSIQHRDKVRGLCAALARDGCDCRLDLYKDTAEDWPAWMTRQLLEADLVLCVVTETYARRFRDQELPEVGLGVGWEAGHIRRLLYAKKLHNDRIFPVLFAESDRAHIPIELQGYDCFLVDGPDGYEALLRKLLDRPLHARPAIGSPPDLETFTTAPLFPRPGDAPPATGAVKADIFRILKYAPEKLIGREQGIELLDAAWSGGTASPAASHPAAFTTRPHILTFVALGGEGKTSLVAKWAVDEMLAKGWPGCDAAFAWSFYSQGTHEQQAASSDLFLKEALNFFATGTGAEIKETQAFAAGPAGAFEKGQRLAHLIGRRRVLLILDGLEPLQYAPTAPTPGELKDQGLAALLRGLAQESRGLCIVTTRYSLPDLKAFRQSTAPEVKLPRLSREAGVHLLKTLGVRGGESHRLPFEGGGPETEELNQFEKLVEDVKGHALTLTLLGTYLRDAHKGDIRKRDLVRLEEADAEEQGGHAFRVIEAYERALEREGIGKRALALLRLFGLFDRPMTTDCFEALLKAPPIPGLTEPLAGLSEPQRNLALKRLEDAQLLTVQGGRSDLHPSFDAHPLIREYFARQLREQQPDAWRAAHQRLYEYLCATTSDKKPNPTLEDLQPLYQAVAHGCQAGLQREAREKVYRDRILRGTGSDGFYTTRKLGAFGSDLGAVACFFEQPWSRVSPVLTEAGQAWLLSVAAFGLRALGRLAEALEPMRAGLDMRVKQQNWKNAAISASNLSELELTLGDVAGALKDAEQSVTYADRSGDAFWRMSRRTTHADALHQAGRRDEALALFREAEQMQKARQSDYPLLYSLRGFKYCDLLLAAAERAAWRFVLTPPSALRTPQSIESCHAVSQRAAQTLKWSTQHRILLDIALDHLTQGRAALYGAMLDPSAPGLPPSALEHIAAAVAGLRHAGQQDELPRGLLTQAWCSFAVASFFAKSANDAPSLKHRAECIARAQEDLDEAWEIAERGSMRLFLADIHLYRARLFGRLKAQGTIQQYPWTSPQEDLAAAEKLIAASGYHRRDEELADAMRELEQSASPFQTTAVGLEFLANSESSASEPVTGRHPPEAKAVEPCPKTQQTSHMQPPIDFVILTPLEEERGAMLSHLGNPKRLPPSTDDIRVYYPATVPVTFTDGETSEYKVVVTDLLGMGRVEAANAVGDAVRRWRPRFVLLVGIAGGLAKAGVRLGDVLISEQIADYELQKLTKEQAETRWSVHRASPALLAAARQLRPEDWRQLVREQRPQPGTPERHAGPICTGDKVIANGLLDQHREVWTRLIGVEMEAGGCASAAFQAASAPGFFMVRGVSDLADPDKDQPDTKSWRAYACDAAAAYVEAFLKSGPVVPVSKEAPNANPR